MLKSLELAGFKSFADRTQFDFSEGITAVVGPNGSGKSNVVDGIKWILGDQSAKSLRGKEMTDVIFNGALNRKGSNLSEATITFDNTTGFLPLENQEVQVGRRLWRSGDSEYLINQETVRLKDIRKLFMGSGVGSAAYSIIEQGRVDQILQANATSRRAIFEEAAGISLYKTRRVEFLRRMERVDQMLLRLTDIVDEVEVQRDSFRNQAEKATKYHELSEELRTLWLGLAADDYRDLQTDIEQAEQQINQLTAEITDRTSKRRQLDEQLKEFDREIGTVEIQNQKVQQQRASIRETVAGHQATIELQTHRQQEISADVKRLMDQRSAMASRSREGTHELAHNQKILQEGEAEFQKLQQHLATYDEQIQRLTDEIQQIRQGRDESQQQMQQKKTEIETHSRTLLDLQSQRQAANVSKATAEKRLTQLNSKLEILQEELQTANQQLEQSQIELTKGERQLSEAREKRETLFSEQTQFRDLLAELREERSAYHARQGVLEDYENRQEGLGIGAREILRRAKTSHYSPWNRIQGSVADLIHVELENAALLEAALGERAQLIVIREFESLASYLLEKTSVISGRVGFVECDDEKKGSGQSEELKDLSEQKGVIQRADKLVKSSETSSVLAMQLLADTWIVETLEVAFQLSQSDGQGCRFVTLQGEFLEADGTLIVGTPRSESAIVSRKSELRKLKTDIAKIEWRIDEEEKRLTGMSDELAAMNDGIGQLEAVFDEFSTTHAELKSDTSSRSQELNRLIEERDLLTNEIEGLAEVGENFSREFMNREMDQARAIEELQVFETEIADAERDVSRTEYRIQRVRDRRVVQELEQATHHERIKGLRESCERLQRDQQQRQLQREEAERRFAGIGTKRDQIQLNLLNTRSTVAELFLADEALDIQTEKLLANQDRLRGLRTELRRNDTALRDADRQTKDQQHKREIQLQEVNHRLDSLSEKIEEEYQMTLTDVVESGASAFRVYLHESGKTETLAENPESQEIIDALAKETQPGIAYEDVRDELESRVNRLRRKRKMMGNVNTDSLQNLHELETRYTHLSTTLSDLLEAKKHLEELVRKIDIHCKELFATTFEAVRRNFQELFRKAFGGGDGDIVLEDPEDVLECGIDIVARPPGKELKSITLMSGGEKTLTAFALLLSIFKYRPSPYCVLDEVDAALDEANVERLLALLEEFKQSTQFVIITHKKLTMTIADRLYGITMEESGVSKRMTVRFENIRENGEFVSEQDDINAAA